MCFELTVVIITVVIIDPCWVPSSSILRVSIVNVYIIIIIVSPSTGNNQETRQKIKDTNLNA